MKWFLFSVILALGPILLDAALTYGAARPVTRPYLLGNGQLLFPAVGLSAAAMGDLVLLGKNFSVVQVVAMVGALVVLTAACVYYALLSGAYLEPPDHRVISFSAYAYVGAVVCSGIGFLLAELERRDE